MSAIAALLVAVVGLLSYLDSRHSGTPAPVSGSLPTSTGQVSTSPTPAITPKTISLPQGPPTDYPSFTWASQEDRVRSRLNIEMPASGVHLSDQQDDAAALEWTWDNEEMELGKGGVLFGHVISKPTTAAECLAQAQQNAITRENVHKIAHGEMFCMQDRAGYVAWMRYLGPDSPSDTRAGLKFDLAVWKP